MDKIRAYFCHVRTLTPVLTDAASRYLLFICSDEVITPFPVLPSVCLSVCLSVHEHISGTAGPIFTKFVVQIPCGSVLLRWRCDTLCTSCFMDDVIFGRNGPYGNAWKAEPLTYYD